MKLPDNCIKGIPNKDFLEDNGYPQSRLFYFEERHTRSDGLIEQSINWEDDDLAIEFSLNQKKENGERQFKAGVAIISRHEIDRLNKQPTVGGALSYERQPLPNNCYHGNILLQADIKKTRRKMIAAALALHVSKVISQQQVQ